MRDEGPDHAKHFFAVVYVGDDCYGEGEGRSKKQAEQSAAWVAWTRLQDDGRSGQGTGDRGDGMPELPEVEVLRRDLESEVVGKKIKSVEVTGTRSVRRHKNKKEFIDLLEGRKIVSVQRRGKYLVIRLDGTDALVVHLGMSGQLLRAKSAREKAPKHTHVVITSPKAGCCASSTRARSARCS